MRRIWLGFPLVLTLSAIPAVAQRFVGGGSTPQGDYLRGIGIAAAGLGSYNRNTAIAESIHVDTAIRLDSYMNTVLRAGRDNWAKIDQQTQARFKANYDKILKRIQDNPERLDVYTGNALNAAMRELNNPSIQESSFRSAQVPIPREMLRRIPFKMDEKGLVFSIQRLTARGKGKWPVAFQQDDFEAERKAYDKAIDRAMGEMIDGKVNEATIKAYDDAVAGLSKKLQARFGMKTDLLYTDAKLRVTEMERASRLIRTTKMQPVMAELDRYTGETVNDLRLFMLAHNLLFAAVDSADERKMYTELYASVDMVRKIVAARVPKGGDQ
jgi:hypothetical protein